MFNRCDPSLGLQSSLTGVVGREEKGAALVVTISAGEADRDDVRSEIVSLPFVKCPGSCKKAVTLQSLGRNPSSYLMASMADQW